MRLFAHLIAGSGKWFNVATARTKAKALRPVRPPHGLESLENRIQLTSSISYTLVAGVTQYQGVVQGNSAGAATANDRLTGHSDPYNTDYLAAIHAAAQQSGVAVTATGNEDVDLVVSTLRAYQSLGTSYIYAPYAGVTVGIGQTFACSFNTAATYAALTFLVTESVSGGTFNGLVLHSSLSGSVYGDLGIPVTLLVPNGGTFTLAFYSTVGTAGLPPYGAPVSVGEDLSVTLIHLELQGGNAPGAVVWFSPGDPLSEHLAVTGPPPSNVPTDQPFDAKFSVEDSSGTVDQAFNGPVTIAMSNNPGGSMLGGRLTVVAANGVADFPNLTLDQPGQRYTLDATSPGVDPAVTAPFDVSAEAQTDVVTTTADTGPGSFRQAIINANNNPGVDDITFDIPASGVQTIQPLSPLPTITDPLIIDGATQPGYAGAPVIDINGYLAGNSDGIDISAGNSTVEGLVINQFLGSGIVLEGGGGNVITRNYIGTDAAGTLALSNQGDGVLIENGSSNNTVGGTTVGAGNVIAAINDNANGVMVAADSNVVAGNIIGMDVSGTALLDTNVYSGSGILLQGANNTVGGVSDGAGNVIAGDGYAGININGPSASYNVVQGNFVGLDAAGTADLGQEAQDIALQSCASYNLIGSTGLEGSNDVKERNVLAGAVFNGISIYNDNTSYNVISGNYIGTDMNGTVALGNGTGIGFGYENVTGPMYNVIGYGGIGLAGDERNVISGNNGDGVAIKGQGRT